MRCLRADDIWEESTIIQDIFSLILRCEVVVIDCSGKNPNVMYEMGIAHTLGKHVVPITQVTHFEFLLSVLNNRDTEVPTNSRRVIVETFTA